MNPKANALVYLAAMIAAVSSTGSVGASGDVLTQGYNPYVPARSSRKRF